MKRTTKKELEHIAPLPMAITEWAPEAPNLRWDSSDWKPTPMPDLEPGKPVAIDFEYETSQRDDPTKTKPFSFSIYAPHLRQGWYCPWGHKGGGNLDEAACRRWALHNLRDRDVYGLNVKAEMHALNNWGIDPELLGIRPHDVAFPPTLLNEARVSGFSLAALAEEYLPATERKVDPGIPAKYFSLAHAGFIAERGISDSYLAWRIHEVTRPEIESQALEKVNALEDSIILPIVDMERNGARIDRPKLERWIGEIERKVEKWSRELGSRVGLASFNPDSPEHLERLLFTLGKVERPKFFDEKKKDWVTSWSAEALEPLAKVSPEWDLALCIREHKSILSKYLNKYQLAMDEKDVVRFTLHQLRGIKDQDDDKALGTATGRFSCGGGAYNVNVQQVMKAEKQIEETRVRDYIIRELFIPDDGTLMGASDASQIEFRLFSHAAAARGYWKTAKAYADDPHIDFHLMVTQLMNPNEHDAKKLKALRKHMKHNNFGVLYGMGREKLARRLGLPCTCPWDWHEKRWDEFKGREVRVRQFWNNAHHEPGCLARQANLIMDEYFKEFPEAKVCTDRAQEFAKDHKFISTLLGRRRRFPEGWGLHKAFNSWDQGSAADYFKIKLRILWEAKKELGLKLRMPVHDEFVYDIPRESLELQSLLDRQELPLHVPLLWDTGYGRNWREANGQ